jgi:3-isopropylmalate dehydrogenase
MDFTICVLAGDGIGPDVVSEGIKVMEALGGRFGHRFSFEHRLYGGIAIDQEGEAVSDATLDVCRRSDAVLMGAVGGPKWDNPAARTRPEAGLLRLREELKIFANIRPVKNYPQLVDATPLKPDVVRGTDMVVIRELTGGLYFGKPKKRWQTARGRRAVDTLAYSEAEVERVLRFGFSLAAARRKSLMSVDKANVLESSRMWREIAMELAPEYPTVELKHMLVDTCSMQLINRPKQFDVIVTENTFGDILTDEAAVLAGSMGMLPSASLGGKGLEKRWASGSARVFGVYEPIHGSAPDIAGKNIANPIATVLSVAMMLRYSLGLRTEADIVEKAVDNVLSLGYRTQDIAQGNAKVVGTREMGSLLAEQVRVLFP